MGFGGVVLIFISVIIVVAIVIRLCSSDSVPAIAVSILMTIVAVPMLVDIYSGSYHNERVIECTVTGKDRGGDNGSYRVYTEDCGVLENTDAFFRGKFDSADVWNQIPDEGVVTFHVVGARIPFFSAFPNILEVIEEE